MLREKNTPHHPKLVITTVKSKYDFSLKTTLKKVEHIVWQMLRENNTPHAVFPVINVNKNDGVSSDNFFVIFGNIISYAKSDCNSTKRKALTIFHFNGFWHVTVNGLCEKNLTIFKRNNFKTSVFNTLCFVQRERIETLFNNYGIYQRKRIGKETFLKCSSRLAKQQIKIDSEDTKSKTDNLHTDMNIKLVVKKTTLPHITKCEIKEAIERIEEKSSPNSMKHVLYNEMSDWFSKMSTCYVYPVSRSLGETFTSLIQGVTTEHYDHEVMSNCLQRLATFQHYVFENVPSSVRLAEAGWYFTGRYKETKCFSCKIVYSSWTRSNDPFAVHKELQSKCEFVIEQDTKNKKSEIELKGCVSNCDEHTNSTCSFTKSCPLCSAQKEENMSATKADADQHPELSRNDNITKPEELLSTSQFSVGGENQNGNIEITKREKDKHRKPDAVNSEECLDWRSQMKMHGENWRPEVSMLQYQHQDREHGSWPYRCHNDEITSLSNLSNLSIGTDPRESLLSLDNVPSTIQVQPYVNGQQQQLVPTQDREPQQRQKQQSRIDKGKMKTKFLEMKHPNFQALPVRMSSFMSWPLHSKLSPRAMALAGFFYKGYSDVVECYWCGISIVDWEEGDDPYIEHVRWQPSCPYMIQTKGEAFSLLVQKDTTRANNRRDIEANNVAEKEIPPVTPEVVTSQYDMLTTMGFSHSDIESAIRRVIDTTGNRRPGFEAIIERLLQVSSQTSEPIQTRSPSLMHDNQPSGFSEQAMCREKESRFENVEEGKQDFSVEPSNNYDRLLCKICLDKQVGVTFAPCGHLTSCMECSQNLTHCPVCRKVIQQKIKCFIT